MSTIAIPKKVEKQLKDASHYFGISQEDILINAALYYFKTLEEDMKLNKEFRAWEKSSDLDLLKYLP